MSCHIFDFLGPTADFNFDGHVDNFEAALFFHMMEEEDAEISRSLRTDLEFDDDSDGDF